MRIDDLRDSIRPAMATIAQKDLERMEIAHQVAMFELRHGPVKTMPIIPRDGENIFTHDVMSRIAELNAKPKRDIAKIEKAIRPKKKSGAHKSRVKTEIGAVMVNSRANRLEAIRQGKTVYVGGAPCPKGHWERRVSGHMCVECDREHSRNTRERKLRAKGDVV